MSTIKFERDTHPKRERDFHVIIDGEHRATFRSNAPVRAGYTLQAADGGSINLRRSLYIDRITQADFAEVVRLALAERAVPTRTEIDRALLIGQAEIENREWDAAKAAHRSRIRGEVMRAALLLYIEEGADDAEHVEMATALFREWQPRTE
jgi:hypothetical protein